MNRANGLLQVAFNAYAPLEAQKRMILLIMEMEAENEPDEAIAVTLADALYEGLNTGDWP
jgi:hypothetical protein